MCTEISFLGGTCIRQKVPKVYSDQATDPFDKFEFFVVGNIALVASVSGRTLCLELVFLQVPESKHAHTLFLTKGHFTNGCTQLKYKLNLELPAPWTTAEEIKNANKCKFIFCLLLNPYNNNKSEVLTVAWHELCLSRKECEEQVSVKELIAQDGKVRGLKTALFVFHGHRSVKHFCPFDVNLWLWTPWLLCLLRLRQQKSAGREVPHSWPIVVIQGVDGGRKLWALHDVFFCCIPLSQHGILNSTKEHFLHQSKVYTEKRVVPELYLVFPVLIMQMCVACSVCDARDFFRGNGLFLAGGLVSCCCCFLRRSCHNVFEWEYFREHL